MKRYLLSLLIVPLLFIGSYSFAYTGVSGYRFLGDFQTEPNGNNAVSVNYDFTPGEYKIEYVPTNLYCDVLSSSIVSSYQFRGCNGGDFNCFTDAVYSPSNPFSFSIDQDYTYIRVVFNGGGDCRSSNLKIYKYYESTLYDDFLTPVITGLSGSINEFIPYLVYIGLGVLGVLISFVAIKRLINWIRAKIFSSFK